MKSLIVGCSITHGSELVSDTYCIDNVNDTYANKLSKHLGYTPNNIAIPGNSNEGIFHDAIKNLPGHNLLIVGWTALFREAWYSSSSKINYFFNAQWGCATNDLSMSGVYVNESNDIKFVSSLEEILPSLKEYHRFITMYKFDHGEFLQKVQHYRHCLKLLCDQNNIQYIDITLLDDFFPGVYFHNTSNKCRGRHPTQTQHQEMLDSIVEYYNL